MKTRTISPRITDDNREAMTVVYGNAYRGSALAIRIWLPLRQEVREALKGFFTADELEFIYSTHRAQRINKMEPEIAVDPRALILRLTIATRKLGRDLTIDRQPFFDKLDQLTAGECLFLTEWACERDIDLEALV